MKDRKRRFETFSFYDRTGIEAHLKKMAEKGWMISRNDDPRLDLQARGTGIPNFCSKLLSQGIGI